MRRGDKCEYTIALAEKPPCPPPRHGNPHALFSRTAPLELLPQHPCFDGASESGRCWRMKLDKLSILRALFRHFGRCSTATRLRWGRVLGWLSLRLLRSRAHIVRTNLALCCPERTGAERDAGVRRYFGLLAQSVVDCGLCWFGSREAILDIIALNGFEYLQQAMRDNRRIILLALHFIGLDAAA